MDFYRIAEEDLQEWRISLYRKPLVIRGARQTGKTTLVRIFGRSFDTFIELNLETEQDRKLFDNDLSVSDLIQYICLEKESCEKAVRFCFWTRSSILRVLSR